MRAGNRERIPEAQQPLEECVAQDPNFADCHFLLGEVGIWMDDELLAEQRYRRAIELDPSHAESYRRLAELYVAYRHDREAAVVLSEGLRFLPDRPQLVPTRFSMLMTLAQLEAKIGDRARALSHVAQAEPLVETGPAAWSFELAVGYVAAGAAADEGLQAKVVALMQRFYKMVCRGAAATQYGDECITAQIWMQRFASTTP